MHNYTRITLDVFFLITMKYSNTGKRIIQFWKCIYLNYQGYLNYIHLDLEYIKHYVF